MNEENNKEDVSGKNSYAIPMAILAAGALIAGAVVYSQGVKETKTEKGENVAAAPISSPGAENVKPVTSTDHILGDPDAPVKIVEFSDLECPFCKSFHLTMTRLVGEYAGKVAWVYRHFPIDELHSKARKEAEAAECAAELGGNEKFWTYVDGIFRITPSNDGLNLNLLPELAENVGLNRAQFENCLSSGRYAKHVEDDYQDAVNSGGTGTPYNIVIAPNGKKFTVKGALPYLSVKSAIDLALGEK